MKPVVRVVLVGLLLGGLSGSAGYSDADWDGRIGCEPSVPVNLTARTVQVVEGEETARVVIEVTLLTGTDLSEVRLRGTRSSAGVRRAALPMFEGRRAQRRRTARTTWQTMDLPAGQDHDIFIQADVATPGGETMTVGTHLRVNLDSRTQPERLDGLVQYRAVTAGS
ncbi:MAG: hypothetical protein ACE5IK_14365 [Acidobacteriota bacterium]